MNKNHKSTFRYPSVLSSNFLDRTVLSDCFQQANNSHQKAIAVNDQQHIYKTYHCHSSTDENQHRNNHNSDSIRFNETSKPANSITPRKRRTTIEHKSNEKSSLLPIYINHTLLILIRLMILFIIVLILSCTFYYAIVYMYRKPKKSGWLQIIDWFTQE